MTATNGWPGKPGVPLNPERDGWHWIQESDLDPECAFWRAQPWFDDKQGRWETTGTEDDFAPYEVSTWRYFGPVLTPDEAAALQARADRNAAGFARVDSEAERAKFLHKQEIATLQKRVAELRQIIRYVAGCEHATASDEDLLEQVATAICRMNEIDPTGHISIDGSPFNRAWKHFLPQARAALTGGKDE